MDCNKKSLSSRSHLVILSLFTAGVIYLWLSGSTTSKPFFSPEYNPCLQSNPSEDYSKDEMESALDKASMANKTVIIAVVNRAYAENDGNLNNSMLDLFLESFWVGEGTRWLLDHLLLVAMDQTAYERCMFRGLHCYRLETDGVDFTGEKLFMSDEFIKMMWRRTLFLLDVLKRGYSFIFTDTDVVWLRDPFTRLSNRSSEDLQISTDNNILINTGFYYVRSNRNTICLFQTWYATRTNSAGLKEQDVLAHLLQRGLSQALGLSVRYLDTLYFSGFCRDSKDVRAVATVHANCCRTIAAKIVDLTAVLRDWKMFKSSPAARNENATAGFRWSPHIACRNSWPLTPPRS